VRARVRPNGFDRFSHHRVQPDQVDTDQHAGMLQRFGINPADLIAKLTAGGGQGGIGDALGKLL